VPNPGAAVSDSQLSIDDLGRPLSEVTFVVLDLETTGGSANDAGITEIGAVKIRGGRVIAEFATLANPGHDVPAFIASLTGITTAMLTDAPSVAAATASLWEFIADSVVVAHNAPYDIGFLKGAAAKTGREWPRPAVVDTARLARRLLSRDDVRNVKLATLATFFGSPTTPIHRALDDARATVAVLHGLIERAAGYGVTTLEDLMSFTGRTHEVQRRKRGLAADLPRSPGVYIFKDAQGDPLYVGTSRCIRDRVRTYFTASEPRARMREMLHLATEVTAVPCASALEAAVREIRLIAQHRPPFNRRSRNPDRQQWLALSHGPQPRLTVTAKLSERHRAAIGPYANRAEARQAIDVFRLLATTSSTDAPGVDHDRVAIDAATADAIAAAMNADTRDLIAAVTDRIRPLTEATRFERAREWRDRLESTLRGIERAAVLACLVQAGTVGAARLDDRVWTLHVIHEGRLVSTGTAQPGEDPRDVLDALYAVAEDAPPAHRTPIPRPSGLTEESRLVWRWLTEPGTRLARVDSPLHLPTYLGADLLSTVRTIRAQVRTSLGPDDMSPAGDALGRDRVGRAPRRRYREISRSR
jgi:DNA polymerase-3 subunit epsilon